MKFILHSSLVLAFSSLALGAPSSSPKTEKREFTSMSEINQTPNPAAMALLKARAVSPGPAANVAVGTRSETKRAVTHLYICSDSNFNGRCQNLESNTGQCYNLYNGFNDVVSSLGPDKGVTCTLFDDYGCGGGHLDGIVNPGIYNLQDYGWNDRASAYRCI